MKVAPLQPNAMTLPKAPSAELEVVDGRQRVVRHGIFFGDFRGKNRALYMQHDGNVILADECKCRTEWGHGAVGFTVQRVIDCPIDEHKVSALNQQQADGG
jgi:hypothetical protein